MVGCTQPLPTFDEHGAEDSHDHGEHDHDATGEDAMRHGKIKSYGPGEAPHLHALDYTLFDTVADIAKLPNDLPAPITRTSSRTVMVDLEAKEVISEIAPGVSFHYWTFNGTIPGPFLRVREGDTVELTLKNDPSSSHTHSVDLHAVTGPGGGAVLLQVEPGKEKSLRFKTVNPGLYVYHCASPNVPMHMANGMYGLILVEPKQGLPSVDKEFYVMQGELYTEGPIGEEGFQAFNAEKMLYENPEYVIFNGRVKSLVDHPLETRVGDTVRLYVGNGGVSFVSSFHVIGEIFDSVYPEAATSPLLKNVQTTLIPAGGATITEFEMDVPGTYVLVDHALARLDKGGWGLLTATGAEHPEIYTALE